MTRKDYVLIAATIHTVRGSALQLRLPVSGIDALARELAINLAVENARFDRVRFLTACGVKS